MPPRTSTLQFGRGPLRAHAVVPLSAKREVRAEASRALNAMKVSWLPVDQLRESQDAQNSRRAYDEGALNELAASIQEHGLLQPILVVTEEDEYRVVCGERRRRASIRAGLNEVPCIVKQHANEQTIFLWNLVENIQRVDLSAKEKVAAIRQLAESGLGVREISRGTGISPGTISKWIRIADKPSVVAALEAGRLDIFRAMQLAPIKDQGDVDSLVAASPELSRDEFEEEVRGVSQRNTSRYCPDDGRLADIDRKLSLVRTITPIGRSHLLRIRDAVDVLLAMTVEASDTASVATGLHERSAPVDDGSPAARLAASEYTAVAPASGRSNRPRRQD